jgi:hypothetical protein
MGSVERTTVRVSLIRGHLTYCSSTISMMMIVSPEAFDAAHAQRWCGLGSAHGQASTSTSTTVHSRVVSTQLGFPWQDDEDDEAGAITTIDHCQLAPVALLLKNANTTRPHEHEHELRLIISGCRWVASSNMGTFWHEASDLDNKDDVASFALLDTLTRWLLPHWQGTTLHVRTNDVCVLRGIRGDYSHSGVWNAVRSLCGQYDVELSAKVVERSSSGILFARGNTRDGKCAAGTVRKALRNPDVVNAAVKWLMESGQQGSTVYRTMLSHLTV